MTFLFSRIYFANLALCLVSFTMTVLAMGGAAIAGALKMPVTATVLCVTSLIFCCVTTVSIVYNTIKSAQDDEEDQQHRWDPRFILGD